MSMSTHIIGFIPPDDKWEAMKEAYDACRLAGVGIPEEIMEFFNYQAPDPQGVEIELSTSEWSNESSKGYELRVVDIPKNVQVIRFYNSW